MLNNLLSLSLTSAYAGHDGQVPMLQDGDTVEFIIRRD